MTRVANELKKLQTLGLGSWTRVSTAESFVQRLKQMFIEYRRGRKYERLHAKSRQWVLGLLRNPAPILGLKFAAETDSGGFHSIEYNYQANELAAKLLVARDYWLVAC